MYIHFEGLDLAGKSTVCRRFCAQAGGEWETRHNALNAANPVSELTDALRRNDVYGEETLGWCYYAALLADLEGYQKPEGNVLQDSTILLRSIAYHAVAGTRGLARAFETRLEAHPRFDYSFVCVADKDVRLDRLRRRRKENLGPEDFFVRDNYPKFKAMEDVLIEYAQKYFQAVIIDTSHLESEEGLPLNPAAPRTALDHIFQRIGSPPVTAS
jgi:thymidylate kinase